jgi:hypothetical protein
MVALLKMAFTRRPVDAIPVSTLVLVLVLDP